MIEDAVALVKEWDDKACREGGYQNILDDYLALNMQLALYNSAVDCGIDTSEIVDKIASIVGSSVTRQTSPILIEGRSTFTADQTDWVEVPESAFSGNCEPYDNNGELILPRYRKLITNELEIDATITINQGNAILNELLENFLPSEFAPSDSRSVNFAAKRIPVLPQNEAVNDVNAWASIGDTDNDGRWSLIIQGVFPSYPITVLIQGKFYL